ncbi:hypothetical protein AcV7_001184 [Taiwanofungus camphoratus]|nr:hypothetical protein AcV7_001184 [Antrodia cinnamomea]
MTSGMNVIPPKEQEERLGGLKRSQYSKEQLEAQRLLSEEAPSAFALMPTVHHFGKPMRPKMHSLTRSL